MKSLCLLCVLAGSHVANAQASTVHAYPACRATAAAKAIQYLGNHMGRSMPAERLTVDMRPVVSVSNQIAVTVQLPGSIAQAMTFTVAFEVNGGCSNAVVIFAQDHS